MKKINLKQIALLAAVALFFTISTAAQNENSGELNVWTKIPFSRQVTESGELINVRAARNKGYDRVVFEFRDKIPAYKINFSQPPFYQGESEKIAKVAGKSFVRVTFKSATAHDLETGKSILNYKNGKLALPVIQETAFIYDFEGMVEFIIGLKQSTYFRISELQTPARLVVDFKH